MNENGKAALQEVNEEVDAMLRDNQRLAVSLLHHRIEAIEQRLERRLDAFDANHTKVQAKQADRLNKLEERVELVSDYVKKLAARVKALEAANDQAKETDRT